MDVKIQFSILWNAKNASICLTSNVSIRDQHNQQQNSYTESDVTGVRSRSAGSSSYDVNVA